MKHKSLLSCSFMSTSLFILQLSLGLFRMGMRNDDEVRRELKGGLGQESARTCVCMREREREVEKTLN
jgi:hypothetical protein